MEAGDGTNPKTTLIKSSFQMECSIGYHKIATEIIHINFLKQM